MKTHNLVQVEMTDADIEFAERMAIQLGYIQTAYTSTSELWGLFCIGENPASATPGQRTDHGCIIKTKNLGFLFVADLEDLHLNGLFEEMCNTMI